MNGVAPGEAAAAARQPTEAGENRGRRRIAAIALGLALALGADFVLGRFLNEPNPGSFRCSHPYYHHGFLPGLSTTTRWGDREYAMHTNSLGFRDRAPREVALEPSGERLLLIGDSFVEGIGVPYEETFASLLEERLAPREVLNAGAVSYAPMLYRLKVEYLLEQVGLRFDRLLVFIDISDIQDEVNYQSFRPHLPSTIERLGARANAFLERSSLAYHGLRAYQRQERGGVSNAIDVAKLADNEIYFKDLEAYKGEGNTQAKVEEGRWEWTIAEPLYEAWGRRGLELAKKDMCELVELCRARDIEVTLCIYPSPVQILMKDLDSIQVGFWSGFAAEFGVPLVNLFPSFLGKEAGRPRAVYNKYFIPGDVHWNAEGHRLVADELSKRL